MIEGKIVEALDSLKLDTCFVMDSATGKIYICTVLWIGKIYFYTIDEAKI